MFLELIATIVAGLACAGGALVVNLAIGRRLPRWVMPVAAALGMIAMTISNEYTWYNRTTATLPEGLQVALTAEEQTWLRPWTRLWPYTKRFVAVDTDSVRRNTAVPDQRLADLYFFGRWSAVNQAPMLFDCVGGRSAVLIDGAEFDDNGAIVAPDWQRLPEGEPILKLACEV